LANLLRLQTALANQINQAFFDFVGADTASAKVNCKPRQGKLNWIINFLNGY
jgi:hypothetical protein